MSNQLSPHFFHTGPPLCVSCSLNEITDDVVYEYPGYNIHGSPGENQGNVARSIHLKLTEEFNNFVFEQIHSMDENLYLKWKFSYEHAIQHLGRSSKSTHVKLMNGWFSDHPQQLPVLPMGSLTCHWVKIDLKERKPSPWSNVWQTLAREINLPVSFPGSLPSVESPTPITAPYAFSMVIPEDSIDGYGHVYYMAYIVFVGRAITHGKLEKVLPANSADIHKDYLKEMVIVYEDEALIGDTIVILVWTDPADVLTYYADVKKGGALLTRVSLKYVHPPSQSNL